jgi:hypothetical protein
MIVYLLTQQQAEQLRTVEFIPDNLFNPVLDSNGNYFISVEEVAQCSIDWVKELPTIEYEPIPPPEFVS